MLNHWLNYIICQDILTGSGAPGISRKGANGVSTNWVTANFVFLTEGLFGYSR